VSDWKDCRDRNIAARVLFHSLGEVGKDVIMRKVRPHSLGCGDIEMPRRIRRQVAQRSWSMVTTAANVACTVMAAFSISHVSGMSPSA